eukprot:6254865-Karenia_brevis.AAC.1
MSSRGFVSRTSFTTLSRLCCKFKSHGWPSSGSMVVRSIENPCPMPPSGAMGATLGGEYTSLIVIGSAI